MLLRNICVFEKYEAKRDKNQGSRTLSDKKKNKIKDI